MGIANPTGKGNLTLVGFDCLGPLGKKNVQVVVFEQQGEEHRGRSQVFRNRCFLGFKSQVLAYSLQHDG